MSITTSFTKISHIEFEFKPDASDPLYSFLQLRLHSTTSTQPHILYIFPSNSTTAVDHLHNIFLSVGWVVADKSPQPEEEPI